MTQAKLAPMALKVMQVAMATLEYKDLKVFLDHLVREVTPVKLGQLVFR